MMLGIYTSKKINHHQIRESLGKLNNVQFRKYLLTCKDHTSFLHFHFLYIPLYTIIFLEFYDVV